MAEDASRGLRAQRAPNPNVTFQQAFRYVELVATAYGRHSRTYQIFMDLLRGMQHRLFDPPYVISWIAFLFAGHSDLYHGFNAFLPPGYQMPRQQRQ
ncbi:MAG: hypothetical protein Q9222_002646 [Ikaeria aurantiellina]